MAWVHRYTSSSHYLPSASPPPHHPPLSLPQCSTFFFSSLLSVFCPLLHPLVPVSLSHALVSPWLFVSVVLVWTERVNERETETERVSAEDAAGFSPVSCVCERCVVRLHQHQYDPQQPRKCVFLAGRDLAAAVTSVCVCERVCVCICNDVLSCTEPDRQAVLSSTLTV